MVHDYRSLLDAVALSVNDRVDSHLKHHSIRCKSKVHGTHLNIHSCTTVRSTLLLRMALKRNVRTSNDQLK